jgi:hypothetical protein
MLCLVANSPSHSFFLEVLMVNLQIEAGTPTARSTSRPGSTSSSSPHPHPQRDSQRGAPLRSKPEHQVSGQHPPARPRGQLTTGLDANGDGPYLTFPGFPFDVPSATYTGDGFGGPGPGGKRMTVDCEGLVLGDEGTFWISDEYGPYV